MRINFERSTGSDLRADRGTGNVRELCSHAWWRCSMCVEEFEGSELWASHALLPNVNEELGVCIWLRESFTRNIFIQNHALRLRGWIHLYRWQSLETLFCKDAEKLLRKSMSTERNTKKIPFILGIFMNQRCCRSAWDCNRRKLRCIRPVVDSSLWYSSLILPAPRTARCTFRHPSRRR